MKGRATSLSPPGSHGPLDALGALDGQVGELDVLIKVEKVRGRARGRRLPEIGGMGDRRVHGRQSRIKLRGCEAKMSLE